MLKYNIIINNCLVAENITPESAFVLFDYYSKYKHYNFKKFTIKEGRALLEFKAV